MTGNKDRYACPIFLVIEREELDIILFLIDLLHLTNFELVDGLAGLDDECAIVIVGADSSDEDIALASISTVSFNIFLWNVELDVLGVLIEV